MWPALARLAKLEACGRDDDSQRCCRKNSRNCFRLRSRGAPSTSADHVHPETVLQLRELEEVVLDDLGDLAAL